MSIDQNYFVGPSIHMLQLIYFPLCFDRLLYYPCKVSAIGYFTRREICFSIRPQFLLNQVINYPRASATDEKVKHFSFTCWKVTVFLPVFYDL